MPSRPTPARAQTAESSQPGVISIRVSREILGNAPRNGASRTASTTRNAVSSQLKPFSRARLAAASRTPTVAAHAASSRARRPNASMTRARPRIEEMKWLASIR